MKERGDLVGSEGGVVEVSFAIASALAFDSRFYFIFYNTVFGGFIGVNDDFFAKIGIINFADGYVHVDTVEEGAGELFLVIVDLGEGASTFVSGVAEIAAGAGIHGGYEHEVGWVSGLGIGARDRNLFVFERLTKSLKDGAGEFGDFVEEENAKMGE